MSIFDIINNFSFSGWGIIVASIITVLFLGVVYWQDTTKRSSRNFFIFSIVVFLWGFASVFFNASVGTSVALYSLTTLYFIAGLISPALFFAIDAFPNTDARRSYWVPLTVFCTYLIISIGFLYPGTIVGYRDVSIASGEGMITFGKLFPAYVFYTVALIAITCLLLVRKYRLSAGIFRVQIGNFLATFVLTASVAIFWTLFIPFFLKTQEFFWVGYTGGALLFLVVTGLIISKYNFWNIKIIVTELLVAIIVVTLIVEIFIANSLGDLFIKTLITFVIIAAGSFLVGSVKKETQSKERIVNLFKELDKISRRLETLDKKKTEFLSIASHHLRDPLTAIKGYASMVKEGSFGPISEPVVEAVGKIYISTGHLITMVSDFMDVARIESGDIKYDFTDVDIKKLVLELSEEMKQNAERSHLLIATTIDEDKSEKYIAVGDIGKIRQVISNLMDNSIKYTPAGEVSLLLRKSTDGKKIILSISDTGIGMSDETKGKIFNKFIRAEGVSKVYTEGTGLGLYVAKEIIKKHEGRIWAESKGEGHGSSFYVELDAKKGF